MQQRKNASDASRRLARRLSPEWQTLRRDVPTFVASAAIYLASLCLVLALQGLASPANSFPLGQPIFWVLAIPLTLWAVALGDYGSRAVAILLTLMIVDGPATLLILVVACFLDANDLLLFITTAFGAVVFSLLGFWCYRRSALKRQGPF